MTKLKKHDLIDAVAEETGHTLLEVRAVLASASSVVHAAAAAGQDAFLFGIGKISVKRRGAKRARDLHTGATVMVPPRNVMLFRASESLNKAANTSA